MTKVGEDIPQSCFPIDESRWETFGKSSFLCVVEEQLSFEYQRRSYENVKMIDAKVVAQESFDVYLMGRDDSLSVSVECDEEVMRLVDQERRR